MKQEQAPFNGSQCEDATSSVESAQTPTIADTIGRRYGVAPGVINLRAGWGTMQVAGPVVRTHPAPTLTTPFLPRFAPSPQTVVTPLPVIPGAEPSPAASPPSEPPALAASDLPRPTVPAIARRLRAAAPANLAAPPAQQTLTASGTEDDTLTIVPEPLATLPLPTSSPARSRPVVSAQPHPALRAAVTDLAPADAVPNQAAALTRPSTSAPTASPQPQATVALSQPVLHQTGRAIQRRSTTTVTAANAGAGSGLPTPLPSNPVAMPTPLPGKSAQLQPLTAPQASIISSHEPTQPAPSIPGAQGTVPGDGLSAVTSPDSRAVRPRRVGRPLVRTEVSAPTPLARKISSESLVPDPQFSEIQPPLHSFFRPAIHVADAQPGMKIETQIAQHPKDTQPTASYPLNPPNPRSTARVTAALATASFASPLPKQSSLTTLDTATKTIPAPPPQIVVPINGWQNMPSTADANQPSDLVVVQPIMPAAQPSNSPATVAPSPVIAPRPAPSAAAGAMTAQRERSVVVPIPARSGVPANHQGQGPVMPSGVTSLGAVATPSAFPLAAPINPAAAPIPSTLPNPAQPPSGEQTQSATSTISQPPRTPPIDVGQLTEQVYTRLVQRLQMERLRKGG